MQQQNWAEGKERQAGSGCGAGQCGMCDSSDTDGGGCMQFISESGLCGVQLAVHCFDHWNIPASSQR
ncbi:hypothetical protein E2C01_055794 [Portunus trituberculatus]|uniref:Uncharacterized protein n=1 Tax=Portunus trituberculatus TaxID=210409 RepID=A0A5B7GW02_PORTR|nr:hypothetical protein [Portunus trituberculatus]